jgi:hypothetical protein
MTWNHRIIHITEPDWDGYEVREVFYDEQGPYAHGSACLLSEDMEGLKEVLEWMKVAFEKPVLESSEWDGDSIESAIQD